MATVTPGITFVSGETVTPAKLNSAASPTVAVADGEVTDAKLAATLDLSSKTVTLPNASVTNDKLSLAANAGEIKKALNADNAPPIFACRAWVNFDGTRDSGGASNTSNTDRFIRASGNVSSVTKTGTGAFTINFTTAFPGGTDDYCVQVTTQSATTSGTALTRFISSSNTQYSFVATNAAGAETNTIPHLNVAIFR